jgi:S-adenosyl-L-methionine hydrolase (adenosine-forming)
MATPVITLLSDWGLTDHYLAAVKGAILRILPGTMIVDISHNVNHFDIRQGSFIFREAFRQFPEGTIHILAIDDIESLRQAHVVVKAQGHYFICADNGLIPLILDEEPEKIIILRIPQDTGYFTFPARDRFAKAACHLAQSKPLEELGEETRKLNIKIHMKAIIEKEIIKGRVMFIDGYENAFTNITEKEFKDFVGNKPFTINFKRPDYKINKIVQAYGDVNEVEMCALFSTSGYLQIAVNKGKGASLLGLTLDTPVNVFIGHEE